jgi:hypothetical protein
LRKSFCVSEKIAENARQVRQYFVVPIAKHDNSAFSKPTRAAIIGQLAWPGMLSAVEFDGEAKIWTVKIERISTDRMLSSKTEAVELIAPQSAPQPALCIRHGTSEFPRASCHYWRARKT